MILHTIDLEPENFQPVYSGEASAITRENTDPIKSGDAILLREIVEEAPTGFWGLRLVTSVLPVAGTDLNLISFVPKIRVYNGETL